MSRRVTPDSAADYEGVALPLKPAARISSMFDRILHLLLGALDRVTPASTRAQHLLTGTSGEEQAYFYLRKQGYVIVARNWRSPRRRSEIDLIGWDGDVLCFVEVKTRTSREVKPAEAAVDREKQRDLAAVARQYLRRVRPAPSVRFDVLSIYLDKGELPPEITLFKNGFTVS